MVHNFSLFCFFAWIYIVKGSRIRFNRLSDSILHYESVKYSFTDSQDSHHRTRKSIHQETEERKVLKLKFDAHERTFDLRLRRDLSIFSDGLNIEGNYKDFSPGNIYEGHLHGEPDSKVHGFIHDGIFEGSLHTQDGGEFHIESAKQYEALAQNKTIHSVIYNVNDIKYKLPHQCGGVRANSKFKLTPNNTVWEDLNMNSGIGPDGRKGRDGTQFHFRKRRGTNRPTEKSECLLYVRGDPTYKTYAGTKSRAMYLMTQHVKRVSHIFKTTDFDEDGKNDGYTLKISKIGMIDTSNCRGSREIRCRYESKNIGVEKFLDIASLEDHQQYCLSYVFAHRDFSDGVLGLAWIGDVAGAGGICDPYQSIGGSMKSLNTGIVSNLNYGKGVPSKVTDITLAHEIGHNFGSQHDPLSGTNKASCAPGGTKGNFIMYPRATSGSQFNNDKFSPCSKLSIAKVLTAKADRCFKKSGEPICGNGVVETGEQCDCGYDDEDSCNPGKGGDKCCNGATGKGKSKGECTFSTFAMDEWAKTGKQKGKICSPSNGPCCNSDTCAPYKNESKVCSEATECAEKSSCYDKNPECPKAHPKKDNETICNNGANTCVDGECTGSLCLEQGKKDCQCTEKSDFCKVCCEEHKKNQSSKCAVFFKNGSKSGTHVLRPPGSPCDNYQGYCDILDKCRKVDAEGPLSRLKKWLFNPQSFNTILDWMESHWWACILIGLAMILFMAGFIACCSVHTPSSNPAKPQHRTLRQTLSRRGRSHNRPSAPPVISNSGGQGYSVQHQPPPGYDTAVRESRILPDYEESMNMHNIGRR